MPQRKWELDWGRLLNDERRKPSRSGEEESSGTKGFRVEAERDYDRILFSNPTRRLADKTQVFPLEINDAVRTRLTHSLEVSNLCRSIGIRLAFKYPEQIFGAEHESLNVQRVIPAMLAGIGLAHDLGNPPFGHQGEKAIQHWFNAHATGSDFEPHSDFMCFDGNPQTFRLLTRLQILNDDYGLNLTHGTLAALVKYPWFSKPPEDTNRKPAKFGIFESEREVIKDIWEKTGLAEGIRHPLTYVMEACDDIAYSVLDAEDTVKKGYASFYDLMDSLDHANVDGNDQVIGNVVKLSREKNNEFKPKKLTSSEMNEVSMQMFRVFAIYHLVEEVVESFLEHISTIMNGEAERSFSLIDSGLAAGLCKALKKFDAEHGYANPSVYRLELKGHNTITNTMDMLWCAIREKEVPFSRYAERKISENYKRVRNNSDQEPEYRDCQLLTDSISGMTDKYLLATHENLNELYAGQAG